MLMQAWLHTAAVAICLGLNGCSQPEPDYQKATDARLQRNLQGYTQTDALEYFEGGGRYVDTDGEPPFDQPYVLPLLKTLEKDFGFEWIVLTPKRQTRARELIAKIPPGYSKSAIQNRLEELQADFPGAILQEWGTDYLSLDFLNVEEAEYLD